MKQAYDAVKWNWNNLDEIINFGTKVIDMGCVPTTNGGIESWPLLAKTEEGDKVMEFGYWLIRCEDGTYYVRPTVTVTDKPRLESPPAEAAGVQEDLFNDKLITRTIKDLPVNATWDEIFSIGTGIPTGTQNMFKVYFNPPNLKSLSTLPQQGSK